MAIPTRQATTLLIAVLLLLAAHASAATRMVLVGPNQMLRFQDQVSGNSTTTINVGDTVQWVWQGMNHSTTSGSCAPCIPDGKWDSGLHNAPNSFSFTFTQAGTFPYFCSRHGTNFGMRGTVVVVKPDFAISMPNTVMGPVFPGQTAAFNGTLATGSGYNSPVALSCTGAAPATCTPNPTNLVPSSSGMAFSIAASSQTAQNFQFEVQAAGSDPSHVTHISPLLILKVVDFALGAPSPGSLTVSSNATSSPVSFTVSGVNGFASVVDLSCGGLPAGASCNFSPSSSLDFSQLMNPVQASVTVTTLHTLQGSYIVNINGSSGAATRAQTFNLNVQADYSLALSNPVTQVFPGQSSAFNGMLTSLDGYTGAVTINCGPFDANAPCTPPPSAINLAGSAAFQVGITANAGLAPGDYNSNIRGTDANSLSHQQPATLRVVDFSITPPSISAVQGNPSSPTPVQLTALGQFGGKVALSCPSPPAGFVCSFSPAEAAPQPGAPATVMLVVSTPAGSAAASPYTLTLSGTSSGTGTPAEITHSPTFTTTVSGGSGSADLAVVLSHTQPPANAPAPVGGNVIYSATVTNNTPASTVPATLVVTFSAPVNFGALPNANGVACTQSSGIVTCTFHSDNASPPTVIAIPLMPPFIRTLTANAFVSSTAADTDSTNNSNGDVVEIRLRPLSRNGLPIGIP